MGIEESKVHHSGRHCSLHFPISEHNKAKSWSIIYQCTLNQWKKGCGESFGFVDRVLSCPNQMFTDCTPSFCVNKQSIIDLRKSSPVFCFRKRVKVTKMAEHFEYNHIPAQLSSIQNFHFKSVLCFHGGLVVLHLARNCVSLFGLVDLHINKFLGVFGKQRVEFGVEAVIGEISPDESKCLIQLPSARNRRVYVFQVYDLRSKDLLTELVLPSRGSIFAFDPRFTNSRLAVSNFEMTSHNSISLVNLTSWERLVSNPRPVPHSSANFLSFHYTKAGHLLLVLCSPDTTCRCSSTRDFGSRSSRSSDRNNNTFNSNVTAANDRNLGVANLASSLISTGSAPWGASLATGGPPTGLVTATGASTGPAFIWGPGIPVANAGGTSTSGFGGGGSQGSLLGAQGGPTSGPIACKVVVFDADSLTRLRVIRFDRYSCPLHACAVNFSPVMSRCGGKMALVVNSPELSHCDLVQVYQLQPPTSLMALARQTIWQVYTEQEITQLGLPPRLLNFVKFQPSFTCAGSCISRSSSTLTTRAFDLS